MAVTHEPVFPQTVKAGAVDIENADGTDKQTLVTGGTDGTIVQSISAVSTDSADKYLELYLNDGATDYQIGEVLIPDGSGTNQTDAAVSVLNQTALPFIRSDLTLCVPNGWTLEVAAQAAVTAATKITVAWFGGDY